MPRQLPGVDCGGRKERKVINQYVFEADFQLAIAQVLADPRRSPGVGDSARGWFSCCQIRYGFIALLAT
ncbi:MAG: hypothetical protein Q7T30_02615 [Planctomycetota bacterium]|nr:hypothetical protein [Planctomycetota bacterium]